MPLPEEILCSEGPEIPDWSLPPGLDGPAGVAPEAEVPDARLALARGGTVTAHVALWWREVPPAPAWIEDGKDLMRRRLGVLGGFAAADSASTRRLLEAACEQLRQRGCTQAIGPMNGNTWRRYRFVVESNPRAPFFLEPRNPPEFPQWWQAAGFEPLAAYSSSVTLLNGRETASPALRQRLASSGVTIRALQPTRYREELARIHALSLRSFARNFLYTPLPEADFLASYDRIESRVDPRLVRLAERGGQLCGFVFALPDLEAASRGEKPALIVKTLAVDPAARCHGLGTVLVDEVQQIARAKGFTESIHALAHEANSSLKISDRHQAEVFRRYSLFQRVL